MSDTLIFRKFQLCLLTLKLSPKGVQTLETKISPEKLNIPNGIEHWRGHNFKFLEIIEEPNPKVIDVMSSSEILHEPRLSIFSLGNLLTNLLIYLINECAEYNDQI